MSQTLTDREWLDQLTLALRLRDVSGHTIGDALAEVESHLAESGQSAAESFGDPRLYAAELSFAATEQQAPGGDGGVIASAGAFAVAGMVLVPTAAALLRGETAYAATWGALVAVVLLAVLVTTIARALRWVVERPVLSSVVLSLGLMAVVVSLVLLTGVAFTLPTVVLVVVAAAVLIAGLRRLRAEETEDDLVTDPVTGGEREPGLAGCVGSPRPGRWSSSWPRSSSLTGGSAAEPGAADAVPESLAPRSINGARHASPLRRAPPAAGSTLPPTRGTGEPT